MQMYDTNLGHLKFKRREAGIFLLASLFIFLSFYGWNRVSNAGTANLRPPLYTLQSQSYVQDLAFSPDGEILALGSSHDNINIVEFWDTHTRRLKYKSKSAGRVYVGAIAFSPNGKVLAAGYGGYSYPINVWNARTGKLQRTLNGHKGNVDFVAFSPGSKELMSVSAYDEKMIRVWNVANGKLVSTRKLQGIDNKRQEFIRAVTFSPDRKVLAGGVSRYLSNSAEEVSQLRLWDTRTGKLIHAFPEQREGIFGLAFSPNGWILVGASSDTTIKVWNLKERKLAFMLRGHRSPVTSVAFSSNGRLLMSGSGDNLNDEPGEVLVWDISTRQLIKILTQNDEPVYSVAFSPNEKMMASSHGDKVKIWSTDSLKP